MMEHEACFSGYCRQMDRSRMVFCEFESDGGQLRLTGTDCAYPGCEFAPECQLAARFREYEKSGAL